VAMAASTRWRRVSVEREPPFPWTLLAVPDFAMGHLSS
jgi:hypothetical protein